MKHYTGTRAVLCLLALGSLTATSSQEPIARLQTLFLRDHMPLTWSYTVLVRDSGQIQWSDGMLDIVFLRPAKLEGPSANESGFPAPEDVIGTSWLVISKEGRRQYWFETAEGLHVSHSPTTAGHLLYKRGLQVGDRWQWTQDGFRSVSAIKDTVLNGVTYSSVVEIREDNQNGEKHLYGWKEGVGLVYYWSPFPNYRIQAVVMGYYEHWMARTHDIERKN